MYFFEGGPPVVVGSLVGRVGLNGGGELLDGLSVVAVLITLDSLLVAVHCYYIEDSLFIDHSLTHHFAP